MTGTAASETDTSKETSTETTDEKTVDPKPTETVEFWKAQARENEKRAKANADAATRLAALEESQKTESQKLADAKTAAERERDEARADALRWKVAAAHGISDEDAELFLTGIDEETLTKQAKRLAEQTVSPKKKSNVVPREGTTTPKAGEDEVREFTRNLFGRADE